MRAASKLATEDYLVKAERERLGLDEMMHKLSAGKDGLIMGQASNGIMTDWKNGCNEANWNGYGYAPNLPRRRL